MLILNASDIQQIYTMQDAIDANKNALRMYSQGLTEVPLRINFSTKNGTNLFMPAYIKENDVAGIKIVSVFPNNPKLGKPVVPGQVLLLDPDTGEVCALIDGTYLTALRTGAVQGAATDLLARKDAKNAVLIGTGGQAEAQLEAMLTVRKLERVAISAQNADKTKKFASKMAHKFSNFGAEIYASTDLEHDITQADIITSVTTATEATFNGNLVKPGTHINAVGAYTPEMHEIPEIIVQIAAIRALDTKEGVFAEAGDIIDPLNQGIVRENDFCELGELVADPNKFGSDDAQITLFKSVGTAVLDVVVGYDIYLKAKAVNVGSKI